jgi:hypothetical protein
MNAGSSSLRLVTALGQAAIAGLAVAATAIACGQSAGTHLDCVVGTLACLCTDAGGCSGSAVCVDGLCRAPVGASVSTASTVVTSTVTSTIVLDDGGTITTTATVTGTASTSSSTASATSTVAGSSSSSSEATTSSSTPTSTTTTSSTSTATTLPGNMITDGDFSMPASGLWGMSGVGAGTLVESGGQGCVTAGIAFGTSTLGWPQTGSGAVLSSAHTYTFSYTVVSATAAATIDAKVGHSVTPFAVDFETLTDTAGATPTTYTHTVTAAADSSAGIALTFSASVAGQVVCFSAVSLVQN